MTYTQNNIRSIAFHEASHAIVNLHLLPDDKIQSISIVPNKESLGRFVWYPAIPKVDSSCLEEVYGHLASIVIVLLAGDAAEYILEKNISGSENRDLTIRFGDTSKALGELICFAEKVHGIPEDASCCISILFKLFHVAIGIVEQLWEHVTPLAERLLKAKELNFSSTPPLVVQQRDTRIIGKELLKLANWQDQHGGKEYYKQQRIALALWYSKTLR